jgi:putative tryptophan/tyrosine transport system substrate-binding protein
VKVVNSQRSAISKAVFYFAVCSLLFLPWLFGVMLFALRSSAEAQQRVKIPRLGALLYSNADSDPNFAALRQALRELGYVEGETLTIEHHFADGKPQRLPELAAELVSSKPDAILALGGDVVPFAQKLTKTIPIVMWISNDPVEAGFVASLARPGGNVTGVTLILDELAGKRVALLKEVISEISRVAVLWNPDHADPEFKEIRREAKTLAVQIQSLEVRRGEDFDSQFQNLTKGRPQAIIVVSSRLMQDNRRRILEFAAKQRLPVIGDWGRWAHDGALLSYGPDTTQLASRVATYVDKILKGAKAGDLPIERPTKFELVINLKTAKQIGLIIPPNVLARADRVIK